MEVKSENVAVMKGYWMAEEDLKALETFRDILYCKYAVKRLVESDKVSVDMKGIEYWAKRLEDLRRDFKV